MCLPRVELNARPRHGNIVIETCALVPMYSTLNNANFCTSAVCVSFRNVEFYQRCTSPKRKVCTEDKKLRTSGGMMNRIENVNFSFLIHNWHLFCVMYCSCLSSLLRIASTILKKNKNIR